MSDVPFSVPVYLDDGPSIRDGHRTLDALVTPGAEVAECQSLGGLKVGEVRRTRSRARTAGSGRGNPQHHQRHDGSVRQGLLPFLNSPRSRHGDAGSRHGDAGSLTYSILPILV